MTEARNRKTAMRLGSIVAAVAIVAAPFAPTAEPVRIVGKFDSWTLYVHDGPQTKVCFGSSQPASSRSEDARRIYISLWPEDGTSELSIKAAHVLKKAPPVTATVGVVVFKLLVDGDRAFAVTPADQQRLIEAMKKGAAITFEGTSEKGIKIKDTYPLAGFAQALQSLAAACAGKRG
ncbi:MAG: invasion associated locus B family protein [Hyphomicrobiaceae bacterium]